MAGRSLQEVALASVSIAPLALRGDCGTLSIPMGTVTIDSTGALPAERGTLTEPSCGTYDYTASGGFFGRQFQFAMQATSRTCPNFNLSGTLTR